MGPRSEENQTGIEAGFASADITPGGPRRTIYHRAGVPIDGETPVADRLHARATAFRGGDPTVVIASLDVLCIDAAFRSRVMEALRPSPLPAENIALCATHTHTAPTIRHFAGVEATPEDYLDRLASRTAEVIVASVASLQPATIAYGATVVDLSVNRREVGRLAQVNDLSAPAGTVDDRVSVARIEMANGGGLGLLFSYAAHPLAMGAAAPAISADYPGKAVDALASSGAASFAQFLQGCCGDINVKIHGGASEAETVGRGLADAVVAAATRARPSTDTTVASMSRVVRLPTRTESESVEVLLQAFRVSDGIFLMLPGEVFGEIGLAIRDELGTPHLFIVGCANTCEVGYIPSASAFDDGGYEVETAPGYYRSPALSPEGGRILRREAVALARELGSVYDQP